MYRLLSLVVSSSAGLIILLGPATASASSQSYSVLNDRVQPGMLVSLTANPGVVEPSTNANADLISGIVNSGSTDINQQPGQVSVENSGQAEALVSTLNGEVIVGDKIGPSSIAGIGTKLEGNGWIVGVAQASFNTKSSGAIASTVTDSRGGKHAVVIGRIPVAVRVSYYAASASPASSQPTTSALPSNLQTAADSLAGKHASLVGVILSFLIIVIGIFLAGQVVISTVRGAFAAIARQPLAKLVITRLMLRAFGIAMLIIASVIGSAFVILRLV